MRNEPFEYDKMMYNEVINYLEEKWQRELTPHERHVLVEGYKFGRLVEMKNEIKILDTEWIEVHRRIAHG